MNDDASSTRDAIASRVRDFYERHPYPPPEDDIEAYRRSWDDARRRAESFLFWPAQPYRDDRSILVAGCGTVQAAHYAVRWPLARVVGIDVSEGSLDFERGLQRKHGLDNLELKQLPVERAGELGETFDHVVCTGVLHHLPDPDAGLRALHSVLAPRGTLYVMVYAAYGRAGIYMLQEYCRRLGVIPTEDGIGDLAVSLRALPEDHPIVPLLRNSPDFATIAGLADALLNPNDRAYSVPQFMEFLGTGGFTFGRWVRQAPYFAECGAVASTPHATALRAMPAEQQYAALELFRGTMVRHSAIAYRDDTPECGIDFEGDEWPGFVPVRLPGTIEIREKLPPGASAVLINRNHTFTDLYLPISEVQERLLSAVDGTRTVGEITRKVGNTGGERSFFRDLWLWDQVVFGR
jgi:SAM-dependent methyltransferase